MKTDQMGIKNLKIPLLIIGLIVLFSFSVNHVSAAQGTSDNLIVQSNNTKLSTIDMGSKTTAQSQNYISTYENSNKSENKKVQKLPDPQIYNGGVPVARGDYKAGYVFSSISSAIAAAKSGDTIMLEPGKTFYEHGIHINKNLNFKVFNNGHAVINGQNLGGVFTIEPGIGVNFQNIIIASGRSTNGGAILNYGYLTINGCIFTSNKANINGGANNGGAIYNKANSYVSISHSTFSYNYATNNGGVIFNYGHLSVKDSTFSSNSVSLDGGAIYNNMGYTLSITDCNFTNNKALYGGVLYNSRESPLVITGCKFTGNTAKLDGGAIQNFDSGSLSVKNSVFTSNRAYGGAAIHNTSNLNVINCTFTSNHATYGAAIDNVDTSKVYSFHIFNSRFYGNSATDGGCIFNYVAGPLCITGCNFTNNIASRDGGAIVTGGTLTVTGSSFTGNHAIYGGAIYNNNGITLTINSSNFVSNKASNIGGAIYKNGGNLGIYTSKFIGNHAINGGAVYKKSGALTVRNNTFTSNSASINGGAIYKDGGSLTVTGNTFTKNIANKYGGAIYTKNARTNISSNKFSGNQAVKSPDIFRA